MSIREQLVAELSPLRAFAISLCGDTHRADDLVQEALMKALANLDKFQEGTNLRAWLFTILRNAYFSEFRKRRHEVEDVEGTFAANLASVPEQPGQLAMRDLHRALLRLPDEQREAVLLVGAAGFAYEEAAEIAGVATGTVKSRVNRARLRLAELLQVDSSERQDRSADSSALRSLGAVQVDPAA
ncbi:sigma-70 family RNA polymerase sigma factor [Algihabitans albus]|uniref:sigma-70 family RNA polymerase sigma factor n=1 Tax=Algihabitans albus TaxID=2164067 RepID=UPI000E5C790F|nr:sigma-70 family RNA polymerase sigma factor [Algihabitans albus]